ncbi:MAG TPA: gliding motility-associated C-terminal domain-containing protein, partial [Bacteroidia bacterium]|nr:gliding motility-associated C-terminal domain-containing protein [Bacteroidia bacterium]HMU18807.1 gliding motility-associated C-terminal domain-containing protein [Bacteroidia bacterium]
SNAAITQDIVNITAGNYTVTVTDSTGCVGNKTQIITQPLALTLNDTITPARCGNPNGIAGVNVTGGTSPYTYLWNTGQSTSSISGLNGGTYTITVTDSKLCTANRTLVVNNTPSIVISIDTIIHLKCAGQNTGVIKVNVTGGSGPLTYTWTPSQIGTDSIFNLAAGTYKLVVKDTANCRDSINVTINSPTAINSSIYSLPETCGINNGKAWVTVSGGTPGYTFLWNNSSTNDTISNLTKGTYSVTIKDVNNCSVNKNVLVDSLGGPAITDSIIHVKCFGENTGAIYITVHGANGPVSYLWSPGGQITQNITSLTAGTYTVTVTDTNSCSSTKSFIVNQPTGLNISFTSVTEKCNMANGSAIAAVSGGTSPYSYLWNNGNTTNNITNLTTGYYTITVTDSNQCTKRDSVFIGHTNGPTITNFSRTLIKCHNDSSGSLTVNVTGGTPFYNYQWSGFPGVNNATLQNIPAGVYSVTVTDANGCTVNGTDSLQNPPLITITHTLSNASCNLNNGIAQISVTGGATPYLYNWSNGVTGVTHVDTLANNFYTVTITDALGCIKTDTFTIQRTPATFVQLTTLNNVTCFGLSNGSITITPTGGDGNYTYQWSYNNIQTQNLNNIPAGSYDVTVTDGSGCSYTMPDIQVFQPDTLIAQVTTSPAGCTSPTGSATAIQTGGVQPYTYLWSNNATSQTINGLSSQIITVIITDNNGCTATNSGIINALSAPVVNISSVQNINCFGGANGFISTSVTGGSQPYNYLWNNGSTTSNISNLSAGIYTLTVTDSAQCSTIITQTLTENPQIQFGLSLIAGPCNGGTPAIAIASPSGGVSPLNLLWSDGSTSTSTQAAAGTIMTLTITDNAGCSRDTTFSMLSTNGPQISGIQTTDIICFGDSSGSATVNFSGGALPINIQWIGTFPVQTNATAINLKAGTYTCIVTDVNGCSAQSIANITHLNSLITPTLTITNASCGNNNAQIIVNATGGNGTYQYKLNNGVYSATNTFTNLAAGSDSIFVKDSNGCEVFVIATISNIQGPVITVIDSANVSCFGSNDGFIILNVTGAAQPITYSWSDGPTSLTRNNLGPGNYTFTAQDSNNCISVRNFIITEPTAITISEIIPNKNGIYNITCNTLADGEIQVIANGGVPFNSTATYNYQWSISGASGATVTSLTAGPYTVTVTDSLGCSATKSFLLTEPPVLNAGTDFTQSICGTDTIILTGNIPSYGFGKWTIRSGSGLIVNPDSITTQITAIANGINVFAWVVYDNFCSDTALYVINKKEKIVADGGIDQNVCDNFVFLAAVPPPSGTGVWQSITGNSNIENPSSPATKVENLSPGKNIFVWTITNGSCTASDTVKIAILPPEECYTDVVMPTGFTPNEDGYNDYYIIRGLDNIDNTLTIFNRWGNLVYEKKNYNNNWDGKTNNKQILPDGTYYAILRIPARNLVLKTYIDLRR